MELLSAPLPLALIRFLTFAVLQTLLWVRVRRLL